MNSGAVQYGAMAAALVAIGVVRVQDIATVAAATAYMWSINKWAFPPRATATGGAAIFDRNHLLQAYVVAAGLVGVYLPMAMQLWAVSYAAGPHTFLLLAQIVSEQLTFTLPPSLLSPPAKAMLPILYNAARLPPLWDWLQHPNLPRYSFFLAIANLLLWYFNIFCFLVPVYLPACCRLYFQPQAPGPSTSSTD